MRMVLRAGPLELDPAERRVRLHGAPLVLRPREYALLHYLLRRRGEAVSKADILTELQDEFAGGDAYVVEVTISYLRRRLAAPPNRPIVETVPGVGYRLSPDGGCH
ncbi:MAG TPA: winged helix-turn-helix domain-containing protein [Mycobacteriales bacterium]|jgi:two-component system OmpR family response regulator|nr:winged helix-turn-helix domain-containing protein [Mycobacteriales bacterium]